MQKRETCEIEPGKKRIRERLGQVEQGKRAYVRADVWEEPH